MNSLNLIKMFFMGTLLMGAVTFYSCTSDDNEGCDLITCDNGGECVVDQFGVAECECPTGYYGNNCELLECSIIECPPNSTCEDDGQGTCNCNPGYEPNYDADGNAIGCETVTRNKYLGTYIGEDICTETGTNTYQAIISAHPSNLDQFLIENFGAYGFNVYAQIESETQFSIPSQDIGELRFSSTTLGTINEALGTVSIAYQVSFISDGEGEECDMILEKN